jgi:hypothetical protein
MLKDLFLTPGRLLTRVFTREKKRTYRSTRSRATESLGTVLLSLVAWLALAGCVLYSIDKAGFLTQALDVGVEVATGGEEKPDPSPDPAPEDSTGSITGSLIQGGPTPSPPANPTGTSPGPKTQPAVETEMWVVVMHTIPKNDAGRQEAERRQAQYLNKGLTVEIMDTDAFPRLKSGNWLIALGPFENKAAAVAASNRAKSFNTGLMILRGL